jgi:DNA repair ATPase RecN
MEGDVLMAGMPLPALLALGGAMLGGVFALLKWFAARMLDEIEQRLKRIDDLENRFERLMAELPLHYQRREDAIREYTAMNAKLDRIYELIMEIRRD